MLEKVISAAYACQPCDDDDEYYDCVDDYDNGGNDYDNSNDGDENDKNASRNNLDNRYTNDVNVNTGSKKCDFNTMNLSCEGCRNETGKGSSSDENNSDPEIIGFVPTSVARNSSTIRCDESREFQRSMDSVTLETVLTSLIVRISKIFANLNSYRNIIQLLLKIVQ